MNANETRITRSIKKDEWYTEFKTCSVCGVDFMMWDYSSYCPGCGRKNTKEIDAEEKDV